MHVESPKQEATISIPGEQKNEEKETKMQSPIQEENLIQEGGDCCEEGGEPADYVNVGDSDNDSRSEKREVTHDDFEMHFFQIVKFGLTKMKQPLCIKEEQGSLEIMPDPPFSLFTVLVGALLLDLQFSSSSIHLLGLLAKMLILTCWKNSISGYTLVPIQFQRG